MLTDLPSASVRTPEAGILVGDGLRFPPEQGLHGWTVSICRSSPAICDSSLWLKFTPDAGTKTGPSSMDPIGSESPIKPPTLRNRPPVVDLIFGWLASSVPG